MQNQGRLFILLSHINRGHNMGQWFRSIGLALTLIVAPALSVSAGELGDKLQRADYVLLMRHALAPGIGDPEGYRLDDCSTQRTLNAAGKAQAGRIGQWLKQQGVASAQVFSSPWCRCLETARLLKAGTVSPEPSLGSFFNTMSDGKASTRDLEALIARTKAQMGKKPLVLVTHHVNIQAYVGENIDSGEMVLARIDGAGKVLSYQRYASP
jgi:phosphohistidine phosphatase SixA